MQFNSCSSRVTLSSAAAALATNGGGSCKGHCLLQRDNETARWQYKRDREREERGERGGHRRETRLISTLHPLARTKPQFQCQWQARSSCSALYLPACLPACLFLVCPVNCQLPRPFISAALTPKLKANTRTLTHTHKVRSHICSLSAALFFALPPLVCPIHMLKKFKHLLAIRLPAASVVAASRSARPACGAPCRRANICKECICL